MFIKTIIVDFRLDMDSRIMIILYLFAAFVVHSVESDTRTEIAWGVPGGPEFNHLIRKLMCPKKHFLYRGKCRKLYYF